MRNIFWLLYDGVRILPCDNVPKLRKTLNQTSTSMQSDKKAMMGGTGTDRMFGEGGR